MLKRLEIMWIFLNCFQFSNLSKSLADWLNGYVFHYAHIVNSDFRLTLRRLSMRRSKLEMYVDILSVLAHKGPLKLTHVMYKANVNCSVLKEYLDFLIKQGLIEERTVRKQRIVYAVTQRGITVLKYFKELKQVLPIVEEARNQASNPILKRKFHF